MKILKKAIVLISLVLFGAIIVGCQSPKTPDTSTVAGIYHQHDQAGNILVDQWIELKSDGTWATSTELVNDTPRTFAINNTNEISLYFGSAKMMYGTIIDGVMRLQVYVIFNWQEIIFYLKK